MTTTTKLIVFGGTGKCGAAVIRRAVQQKTIEVTVYARRPERIPSDVKGEIHVIKGDVLDTHKVENAMKGQDVVISCLGKGLNLRPTTLISEGTKNIVRAMRKHQVKRLIVVSIASRLPTSKSTGPWILKDIAADHDRMLEYLNTCKEDIEWCGLMVPEIFDLPITKTCQVAVGKRPGPVTVTTGDMADFMVKTIQNEGDWETYKNNLVGLSSTVTFSQVIHTSQGKVLLAVLTTMFAILAYGISTYWK